MSIPTLFGTYPLTPTKRMGAFFCPRCGQEKPYKLKEKRETCHIYFVPLKSRQGGTAAKYVKCQGCGMRFDPEVLNIRKL